MKRPEQREKRKRTIIFIYLFIYVKEGSKVFFIELCEERDSKDEDGFVRRREKSFRERDTNLCVSPFDFDLPLFNFSVFFVPLINLLTHTGIFCSNNSNIFDITFILRVWGNKLVTESFRFENRLQSDTLGQVF